MGEPVSESALAGREARHTSRRRSVVVLAVAGSVAAVLVVVLIAVTPVRGHRAAVSGAGLQLTGIDWMLTQVGRTGARPVTIPQFTGADLEFHRDGTIRGDDGLNALNAEYSATATTITVRNPSESAVGAGHDPVLDATRGSLGGVLDYQGEEGYTVTGRVLTIQIPGWTLTFINSGPIETATVECPSGVETGVPVTNHAKPAPTPADAVARYLTRPDPRLTRYVGPATHWHVQQEYRQAIFYASSVTLHVVENPAHGWLVDEGSYCQ